MINDNLKRQPHRLNMELDLQSLFGLHVHSCAHWLGPRIPPPPALGLIYEGAVGQPRRRHLFVTPCSVTFCYFIAVRWGGGGGGRGGFTVLSSWSRKTSDLGLDGFLVRNITLVISFLISASSSLNQYI